MCAVRRDRLPTERVTAHLVRPVVFRDGDLGDVARENCDSLDVGDMPRTGCRPGVGLPLGDRAHCRDAVHGVVPRWMVADRVVPVLGHTHGDAVTGIAILRQHVADVVGAVVTRVGVPVAGAVVALVAVRGVVGGDAGGVLFSSAESCCSSSCLRRSRRRHNRSTREERCDQDCAKPQQWPSLGWTVHLLVLCQRTHPFLRC